MALFGALLGLAAPGFNLWLLAWIALIPALAWTKRQTNWQTIFWGGFWFGFWFQGLYCSWFFDLHPLTWLGFDDAGSRLTTLAGWLLITMEGGLLCGGLMCLYAKLSKPLARILFFPLCWVIAFYLLQLTSLALPWGLLDYTQTQLPSMLWLASFVGASGLTYALVLHNTFWTEQKLKPLTKGGLVTVLPLLAWAFNPFATAIQQPLPLPVAIIQANLPIELIRSSHLNPEIVRAAYYEPLKASKFPKDTLVVYPEEGVVPGLVNQTEPLVNPLLRELQEIVNQQHLFIAAGVIHAGSDSTFHNSIALLSPQKPVQFYHKRRLVPFGEYTPYELGKPLSQLLTQFNIAYNAPFSSGSDSTLLYANNIPLGGLLCFELIDADPLWRGFAGQYQRQKARLLVNASNLGWFHENPLMEAQFLAIGQMRAAENRTPLVLSSNTGISAIINAHGLPLQQTKPYHGKQNGTQILFLKD